MNCGVLIKKFSLAIDIEGRYRVLYTYKCLHDDVLS